ncbi:MAG TPA: NAD(P)/FAD-dependent oxidoreductase, partial [Bacillota bacterium]|nr:NAD(P)/FAD-dependent oxidoreductase [Bacillota bacterium]
MYDTIIVGAGITGLQLGALLAADGEKVLVCEKSSRVGGRAAVMEKEGFMVDYGIHVVRYGPQSALAETCRRIGREVKFLPLGPSYVLDYDGKIKVFPTGPKAFLTSKLFSFGERLKVLAMFSKIRKGNHEVLMQTSVADWMAEHNISGGLKRYFHLVSGSMLVCPFVEKASAGEMLTNMKKVLEVGVSVMYPQGGWDPLIKLFAAKINERGEVRTGAAVQKIAVDGKKNKTATGVYVGGEVIPAGKVVLSLPARQLDQLLAGLVDEEYLQMCRRIRPTSGIVLDYGLSRPVSGASGLNYLYEPMSFGMFTSNVDPSLAPEGKQLLTWLQPLPQELFQDKAALKAKEQELEQALFKFFPGLEQAIQWRRAL